MQFSFPLPEFKLCTFILAFVLEITTVIFPLFVAKHLISLNYFLNFTWIVKVSFFQFFACASWILWNLMDIIWIWNGNEGKNRCVAVFCPKSVRRVAVTGSRLVFLQNIGLTVGAARAILLRTDRLCVTDKTAHLLLVQICYSRVSRWCFEQLCGVFLQ